MFKELLYGPLVMFRSTSAGAALCLLSYIYVTCVEYFHSFREIILPFVLLVPEAHHLREPVLRLFGSVSTAEYQQTIVLCLELLAQLAQKDITYHSPDAFAQILRKGSEYQRLLDRVYS
jgi:hypothetical protein